MPRIESILRLALLTLGLLLSHGDRMWAQAGPTGHSLGTDWLLDSSPYEARVTQDSSKNEVTLSNGLVQRVFRTEPNGATVALDNLMTGESLLRGVKPEAWVTIDGHRFAVGGLNGQPNYAYLLEEWLTDMVQDPLAMSLVDVQVVEPTARIKWKRPRHYDSRAAWPPKGIELQMTYRLPELSREQLDKVRVAAQRDRQGQANYLTPAGDTKRPIVIDDDLASRHERWIIHQSETYERSSFENEGKFGEIYTPQNTSVYAETELPSGVRVVQVTVDPGTDSSASWGPGIALLFEDKIAKFNLRYGNSTASEDAALGFVVNGREQIGGDGRSLEKDTPVTLRIRIEPTALIFEAKQENEPWRIHHVEELEASWGEPRRVRIGKLDINGGGSDFKEVGAWGRSRLMDFRAFAASSESDAEGQAWKPTDVTVTIHYRLYDGLPAMSKWLTVQNNSSKAIRVDRFTSELLAIVEPANWVEARDGVPLPQPDSIHVETDFAFGGFNFENANRHIVHWRTDPQYSTQVNYLKQQPCLLAVEPTYGPAQRLEPGEEFESCRAFELIYDSTDRERRGLALRKMYRTVAPWVTENPLMHHMRVAEPKAVREAIDQAADVGFEMIILSFGSGFDMENDSQEYLDEWRDVAQYAREKGIEIGAYSLLSSRRIGNGNDIVSPPGMRPTHGSCPALTSPWGQEYFKKLDHFFATTGFTLLEHDGSYPGDVDVTPRPPLQQGIDDSRWVQWSIIRDFYQKCRERGVYLNVPDYYFLSGSNKCGMGYREVNWSLPRAMQVIHTRQNIYDGTWTKTPSMGWMFVPLSQYHGGGAAATIEPLDQHRDHYARMLDANLGLGVQACFRGPRLYDSEATRRLVAERVAWFKTYRDILESDVIHGRRADGRDIDWMLHVNPNLDHRAMLVVYNPLDKVVKKEIGVSLYYSGLNDRCVVSNDGQSEQELQLDSFGRAKIKVEVPPGGMSWYLFEPARDIENR